MLPLFTSAEGVVFAFVCLSVCPPQNNIKKLLTNFYEFFGGWDMWLDYVVKFWWWSAWYVDTEVFNRISTIARWGNNDYTMLGGL